MATNIDRASNGTVTFDFGGSLDPIVLSDSNDVMVSSEETKDSLGTIIRQDISFMRSEPYFFYSTTYSQIGTINGSAKPAIGAATTTLLQESVFQGTSGDGVTQEELTAAQALKVAKAGDTMTGQLIIADTINQTKVILCKHPTGGASDAPTAFDLTSSYLHLGGTEYGTNSYRLLTFGYRRNLDKSHAPALIGYQETSASSDDKGRLIFATRDVTTDTAPTVRLHIETNGDIAAQTGARFVGNGNGLTGVVGAVANTLTTGRTFSLTGGATGVSAAFNGSANASIAVTLATPTGAIRGGVLQAVAQADSTATDIAGLVADFNSLLAKLRTAGIIAT